MKGSTWLILALVGFGVYYYGGVAFAGNNLNVVFQSINPNGLTSYTITFMLQNVTNTTLQFNSLEGDVTVNGSDVGNVSYFPPQPLQVPPNSQVPISVSLNLSVLGLPAAIANLIGNSSGNYDVKVTGLVNVNGVVSPLNSDTSFAI